MAHMGPRQGQASHIHRLSLLPCIVGGEGLILETDEGDARRACPTLPQQLCRGHAQKTVWPLLSVTQKGGSSTRVREPRGDSSTVIAALDIVAENMETVPVLVS